MTIWVLSNYHLFCFRNSGFKYGLENLLLALILNSKILGLYLFTVSSHHNLEVAWFNHML